MKYITADETIHITHWAYVLDGLVLSVIYEKDGEHKRHIKFLQPSPSLEALLLNHLRLRISVNSLNEAGANWVDEEPYFEKCADFPVEVEDGFIRYCTQNGITVSECLHGISCFLCNPLNKEYLAKILPTVLSSSNSVACL